MTQSMKSCTQQGSILLLTLLLLAIISILLTNTTTRTTQHSRLIRNYQQHFSSIKQVEACQRDILKTFNTLPDANTWSPNGSLSRSGLYNQAGRTPFNIQLYTWNNNSKTISKHCQYIIEYLGTINPGVPANPSISKHIVRTSIRFKSKLNALLTIQSIFSVDNDPKNLATIKFLKPPKQQQWTLIQ